MSQEKNLNLDEINLLLRELQAERKKSIDELRYVENKIQHLILKREQLRKIDDNSKAEKVG